MKIVHQNTIKPFDMQAGYARMLLKHWQIWDESDDGQKRIIIDAWLRWYKEFQPMITNSYAEITALNIGHFMRELIVDMVAVKCGVKPEIAIDEDRLTEAAKSIEWMDSFEVEVLRKY